MKKLFFLLPIIFIIIIASKDAYLPWIKTIGNQKVKLGTTLIFTGGSYSSSNDTITITGSGGADNLGNHTATQQLSMAGFNIILGNLAAFDTVTQNIANTNQIRFPVTSGTITTGTVAPETNITALAGSIYIQVDGTTTTIWGKNGSGNTGWFVIAGGEYKANVTPTTNGSGEFTVTHNLGTTQVITDANVICDACNYTIRRKTTGGITNTQATFVVRDNSGTINNTALSIDVLVKRTQ